MTVPNFRYDHFGGDNKTEVQSDEKASIYHNWTKIGDGPLKTFKVIVIGDSGVGKTCLTLRICAGKFPKTSEMTIGVDVKVKRIQVGEEYVDLQIWDSAGQERFRYGLIQHYYRNIHAVVFVYDVTCRSSFENLQKWIIELHKNVDRTDMIPQIIIGNKCDLHADRKVSSSEAKGLSTSFGLPLWETSAKSDMEVDTLEVIFQQLGETLMLKSPLIDFPPHFSNIIQADHNRGLKVHQSLSDCHVVSRYDEENLHKKNCCS